MSDLFHEEVPFDFVDQIFNMMEAYPQHIYQILTKRPERLLEYARMPGRRTWPDHVWIGVSVENQYWADKRVPLLRQVPAEVRFLSCEPLLRPLELDLEGIHWVIVGGESGSKARPMKEGWVRDIRDQCLVAGAPFFFKQWGGRNCKSGGRMLDGRTWEEMPGTYCAVVPVSAGSYR
jgi:protein gp37